MVGFLEYLFVFLILKVLERDFWREIDFFMFDFIGLENKIICYEVELLFKKKILWKFMEEIFILVVLVV